MYAFPSIETGNYGPTEHPGMNLRDYFAAKCVAAIIGMGNDYTYRDSSISRGQEAARDAYTMADYMLLERAR